MGMTAIEKILARASHSATVVPGQLVVVDVDLTVYSDVSFYPNTRRHLLKVHDPDKIAVIFDHVIPAPDAAAAEAQKFGREFVKRFGIKRFHDVGPNQGIAHVVASENGYVLPGTVLIDADSHTCAAGAMNCAGRGVGSPDTTLSATTGQTWFRVGETVRYDLEGQLPFGVSAKDVFLHIAQNFGDHTNQNIEFGGSGLRNVSINARRTLATMAAELSAEFATFEADDLLIDYIKARTDAPFQPQNPDPDAKYAARRRLDLAAMEPLVALPDGVVRNSVPISKVAGTRIEHAFIGSCANGTLDDLAEAARVVAGKKVAPGVRFLVTPGSQNIFREALKAGYVEILSDAGAIVTPSTCGACFGGHMGLLGPDEVCITASTRNFKGRMGDPTAQIYMASPATVAAAAIAGHIVHPEKIGSTQA